MQVDWIEPVVSVNASGIGIPWKANLLIEKISLHRYNNNGLVT